jgi:hypothetical protein
MPEYTERQEIINKSSALARRSFEGVDLRFTDILTPEMPLRGSPADSTAGCIELVSEDSQVCLRVPVVGDSSVPADLPDGTAAEDCVDVGTHRGVPAGACVRPRVETTRRDLQSVLPLVLTWICRPPPASTRSRSDSGSGGGCLAEADRPARSARTRRCGATGLPTSA